jgi:hypothetical protein
MKSIVFVLWILTAWLLPSSLLEGASFRFAPHALAAERGSPPSLMATEQEIRGFFDEYVKRYNKMDVDGFLWLFSLKARQNQRDGLPEIRILYSEFFNQMISVQNSIEEMKIEIYQNAAEVKARFSVNQVLKKGGEKKVLKGSGRWVLIKENGLLKILSIGYKLEKTL